MIGDGNPFPNRGEQLGSGEDAGNIARLDDVDGLFHDVGLVTLHLVEFLPADEALDPAGIEIDVITTPPAMVGEMLHGESESGAVRSAPP